MFCHANGSLVVKENQSSESFLLENIYIFYANGDMLK